MAEPLAPLDDPRYVPLHPPIDGAVPWVVRKWGPRSQHRWFRRFAGLRMPGAAWDRYYCVSLEHRGLHCDSCLEDEWNGYGGFDSGCCCRVLRDG